MNVLNVLGSILQPVADIFKAREQRKVRSAEIQDAVHARTVQAVTHAEDLEQAVTLAQINTAGWKDEWFTFVLSIPLIGAFIPKAVPYIMAGFEALDKMPPYYKGFVGAAIASAFGLKTVDKAWKWWNTP